MVRVEGASADGRDVYLTALCPGTGTAMRRVMMERVPGTGSGGWMYAGTGTYPHGRRQVWDFAECTYWQPGTGTGLWSPFSGTNPYGYVSHTCCPNRRMPSVLHAKLDAVTGGDCGMFSGASWELQYRLFPREQVPCTLFQTGADYGMYVPVSGPAHPIFGNVSWGPFLCCLPTIPGPHGDCWHYGMNLGIVPTGFSPVSSVCAVTQGHPEKGLLAGAGGPNDPWGHLYCPPRDAIGNVCETPFSFCRYFVLYPEHLFAGAPFNTPSCCTSPTVYRIMFYEPGGQGVCGGTGTDFFSYTGTGSGPGTGTIPLGPYSDNSRRNRSLLMYWDVDAGTRGVWAQDCCRTGTGTDTGFGTSTFAPGRPPSAFDCSDCPDGVPSVLTVSVTVTAGTDDCGVDGLTLSISNGGGGNTWVGTSNGAGGSRWTVYMWCAGGDWWFLLHSRTNDCTTNTNEIALASCSPLLLSGNFSVGGPVTCPCAVQISVNVTQ